MRRFFVAGLLFVWVVGQTFADNPFITHIFTADPSARVFDDVLYVYPSHDIPESPGVKGVNGFCMPDYHVFSSTDLMNFKDHGVALKQEDVTWALNNNSLWAPDCMKKGDRYYFYYPANATNGWFKIGVAVSGSPTGPFVPEPEPIEKIHGIDPGVFIDDDGTPYLYHGCGKGSNVLKVVELSDDMKTPASEPEPVKGLDPKYDTSWREGSFMFKRNGIYYFSYPVFFEGTESVVYATGDSATGTFTPRGKILDQLKCHTSHHSVVKYKGEWYLFYHDKHLSGDDTLRSICADRLFFNEDGSIKMVIPTRRGIGIRKANEKIQIDRYLSGSEGLITPAFSKIEPSGFYLSAINDDSWINYPDVDFGTNGFATVSARVASAQKGSIEIRTADTFSTLLGTIPVSDSSGTSSWKVVSADLAPKGKDVTGLQDLRIVFSGSETNLFNVDWVRFE